MIRFAQLGCGRAHVLQHRPVVVEHLVLLRVIAEPQAVSRQHLAGVGSSTPASSRSSVVLPAR